MIPSPEQEIMLLSPLLGKNLALKILARWLVLKFVNTCEIKNKINFEPVNQKLLNTSTLLAYKFSTSVLNFDHIPTTFHCTSYTIITLKLYPCVTTKCWSSDPESIYSPVSFQQIEFTQPLWTGSFFNKHSRWIISRLPVHIFQSQDYLIYLLITTFIQ